MPLTYPKDKHFRPTQAKVRSAVFSILGDTILGASFLDLCCGTGGMGLEAYSRGAGWVTMVDVSTRFAQDNLCAAQARIGQPLPIEIVKSRLDRFLSRSSDRLYSVLFFDPPWHEIPYAPVLKQLEHADILAENAKILCEHHRSIRLERVESWVIQKQYTYGDACLTVYQKEKV
jgi:16S rRNA (guanine966-N2)-methyltransferase